MRDIRAACDGRYTAAHNSGRRAANQIRYVVIHCTEASEAEGSAVWFQNPASQGSAHLVIDDDTCFRTLPDLTVPWAAPPLNTEGFHIELAGHASWTRSQWLDRMITLRRAAYKTADRCYRYGIPVRKVGPLGLRLRRAGITGHADVSKAFRKSNHTDPGAEFPWARFMQLVVMYYDEINGVRSGGGKASAA